MKTPPSAGPSAVATGAEVATAGPETAAEDPPGVLSINLFGRRYRLASADQAFWRKAAAGDWEAGTLRFFDRALNANAAGAESVCVDVGAWIGPTALFAAQFCGRVFAVEPDPAAYERLLANLRLNAIANIAPCHAAITAADGRVQLANHRHFGNSMTRAQSPTGDNLPRHPRSRPPRHPRSRPPRHPRSLLSGGGDGAGDGDGETSGGGGDIGGNRATVLGLRLQTFIDHFNIARIDLLKIDIEGGEFALLPALLELPLRYRPAVHLSLHAPLLPEPERAEKLSTVAELASQYAHIYDADNAAITADAITEEARFRDKFQAVALTHRKLF